MRKQKANVQPVLKFLSENWTAIAACILFSFNIAETIHTLHDRREALSKLLVLPLLLLFFLCVRILWIKVKDTPGIDPRKRSRLSYSLKGCEIGWILMHVATLFVESKHTSEITKEISTVCIIGIEAALISLEIGIFFSLFEIFHNRKKHDNEEDGSSN